MLALRNLCKNYVLNWGDKGAERWVMRGLQHPLLVEDGADLSNSPIICTIKLMWRVNWMSSTNVSGPKMLLLNVPTHPYLWYGILVKHRRPSIVPHLNTQTAKYAPSFLCTWSAHLIRKATVMTRMGLGNLVIQKCKKRTKFSGLISTQEHLKDHFVLMRCCGSLVRDFNEDDDNYSPALLIIVKPTFEFEGLLKRKKQNWNISAASISVAKTRHLLWPN